MQRLNLEEIGRLAGVSRSTVSRVVNDQPNVSEAVKRRVNEVISETGYRPHAAARSLASNRTGVVGLVIPSAAETLFDDPYFGRLILGASGAANELGITLALFLYDQDTVGTSIIDRVVRSGFVDGVMVTASKIGDPTIAQLRSTDLPFVVVGRPDESLAPSVFSVDADNRGGARTAGFHMAKLGRSQVGLISPPSHSTAGLDRRNGFLEGLAESELTIEDRIAEGDWTEESGYLAMTTLLKKKPDAVFIGSDRMANGALRAIRDAGLKCPEDIAVVSFDGLLASQTTPRLTSVSQPVAEIGQHAATVLQSMIEGTETSPKHLVFPTQLVVRESCGTAEVSR